MRLMNHYAVQQMSFQAHASHEHQPAGVPVQSQADFIMGMPDSDSHEVQYNHTISRDNQRREHQQNFQLSLPAKILLSRGHMMAQSQGAAENESLYSPGDARGHILCRDAYSYSCPYYPSSPNEHYFLVAKVLIR